MGQTVIVIGVGAMGSAACHRLARRGHRVIGLEAHSLGHDRGSSHGQTRLIRQAYFEHPGYVPLLKSAYALWAELEAEAKDRVFHRTGLILFGSERDSRLVPRTVESARLHGIPLEKLGETECRRRFPRYRVPEGFGGAFEPGAGYLDVEKAVVTQARVARARGADIREGTRVTGWRVDGDGVRVSTTAGDVTGDKLVLTPGAWASSLLADLGLTLVVHRQMLFWLPAPDDYREPPCFAYELGENFFYGFPKIDGRGLKIANHFPGPVLKRPEDLSDVGWETDRDLVARFARDHLPGVGAPPGERKPCLYTMSVDGNFYLGLHPRHPQVAIAAGFSGHGFKFAPIVGEVLSDLAESGRTSHSIGFLGLRR